jgi:hypothetical protein
VAASGIRGLHAPMAWASPAPIPLMDACPVWAGFDLMSFQPGRAATACKTASGLTPAGGMPSLNGAAVLVAHQSIPLTRQGDPMNRLTLTGRPTADPELR